MKKDIHPDYHEIEIVMTDGTIHDTLDLGRTWRQRNWTSTQLHPAWTGGSQRLVDTAGQVAKFNNRFKDLGLAEPVSNIYLKKASTGAFFVGFSMKSYAGSA